MFFFFFHSAVLRTIDIDPHNEKTNETREYNTKRHSQLAASYGSTYWDSRVVLIVRTRCTYARVNIAQVVFSRPRSRLVF